MQHQLTKSFTVIMSLGAIVSVFVGWLIDQIGVEACTAITLISGQMQMIMILLFRTSHAWFVASFWVYTFFRQFLYPVYIASLTSRLGFKYFGVLLGLGFGAGGVAQLFLSTLDEAVRGDCHLLDSATPRGDCNRGLWVELHVVQFILLGVLLIAPLMDHREKVQREEKIRQILSEESRPGTPYGTERL